MSRSERVKEEFGLKYDAKDIGAYIHKLRIAQKMSQYQLARCSGIGESVLMHTEKGSREPRLNTLLKIIDGLDMLPAEFWAEFN
ncbi:putative XRE family transcriptional regulators [Candidatus Termititenax aidoneus]|uniref:XRE family transcriptional regulators n=1 Tax=Termititenax aidoneus TaxID=2218524 RepID=A0A388T9W5_TERA1|nr:putative XRE family transcriptional regulators [Candidatus Termititenax aidoneus]